MLAKLLNKLQHDKITWKKVHKVNTTSYNHAYV